MIQIRKLVKIFGDKIVLDGISLDIEKNKTTVILGGSGSGKSTTIKHIIGLLKPTSGEILFDGGDIAKATKKELLNIRKKIGFLFQSGALFDSMNIYDNLAFPLREHTKDSKSEIKRKVYEKLDIVGLNPDEVVKLYPEEVSGGMQKRVGLARTVILQPQVILYDEPTSGLDPITSDLISKLIIKMQQELNTTAVVISHDIAESFKVADKMALLHKGKIILNGKPTLFKTSQDKYVRSFIDGIS